MRPALSLLIVAGLLGVPACTGLPGSPAIGQDGRMTLSGIVQAPSQYLPVTPGTSYGDQARLVGVAGATVTVTDGKGQPLPGVASVTTDEQGHYSLPNVPAGRTHVVRASFQDAGALPVVLKTLIVPDTAHATAHLSPATTHVTEVLAPEGTEKLGPLDSAAFQSAVVMTGSLLSGHGMPSLRDAKSIRTHMQSLAARTPLLKSQLATLESGVTEGRGFEATQGGQLLAGLTSNSQFNIYVEMRGIQGTSTSLNYPKSIEAFDLFLDFNHSSVGSVGPAASGGRVAGSELIFTKQLDGTSPQLFQAMMRSDVMQQVTLFVTSNGFELSPLRRIDLGSVRVTGLTLTERSVLGNPLEEVRLSYGQLLLTETRFDPTMGNALGTWSSGYDWVQSRPIDRLPNE